MDMLSPNIVSGFCYLTSCWFQVAFRRSKRAVAMRIKQLKTGALCCIVASRPLVTTTKSSPSLTQDDAFQWQTNFSFSPAGYTGDNLEQDMSDETLSFGLRSNTNRQRKSLETSFLESPRWASNSSACGGDEQKTSIVNSVPRLYSSKPQSLNKEKGFERESTAISSSFKSLLSLSESSAQWVTPRKQLSSLTRCSYPQVFCNPVSDFENHETDQPQEDSSTNHDSSLMISTTNHQGSPVEEASPKPSYNTSSNEMLLDVERSISEVENLQFESGSITHQRCGICKKLLSQKSPWCSSKILRCGDMLTTGVFPCHHVYHVECLDKVTPTAQTRDPLCPACTNTIGAIEQPATMPETLQMALRSLRRSHTAVESETVGNQTRHIGRRSQKWEKLSCCLNIRFTSSSRILR